METQGVRKFLAFDPDQLPTTSLKLWLFTPDLSISSSVRSSTQYIRVAKVLWQDSTTPEIDIAAKLNSSALSEGELKLGCGEVGLLRRRLEESGKLLPENARMFQDWHVGLLERFTVEDLEAP